MLEYYRARPTFRTVNGAQAPDVVARELDSMVDEARKGGPEGAAVA